MTKIINNLTSNAVRVRIAPSPTGFPHIGNTRTALFNYLFARHNNGKFIVRIEDTDKARLVPGAEKAIYEILTWLGLNWDEKYKQSERIGIYKKHAEHLLEKNLAYKEERAIRFKMPKTGETSWIDLIGNKNIVFKNETQEDFIIIKSDGYPTYNFANVIDDHLMNISHVIRGEEFISSTPKHIQLYNAFGWKPPFFAHLPVVLGPDRSKLSKRHGAESVLYYRNLGYLKEALLNYMVILGWNPGGDREILTLSEMIKLFDLKDINTNSPIFDVKKLEWMNGVYIRMLSDQDLKNRLEEFIPIPEVSNANALVSIAKSRMKTLADFQTLIGNTKAKPLYTDDKKELIKKLGSELESISEWNKQRILECLLSFREVNNLSMKDIYILITGQPQGLPLPEMLQILGKEKVLERLNHVRRG